MIVTPRNRKPFENKYARLFKKALRDQLRPVLALNDYQGIEQRIHTLVSPKPIIDVFLPLYREVGSYFAGMTVLRMKRNTPSYETKADEWVDIWGLNMESYALNIAGARITWITEASKDLILSTIRSAITEANQAGVGISQATDIVQRELVKNYGKIERWRAMRIANTEILTASNRGAQAGAESLQIPMEKRWSIAGRNVRDTHVAANGQTVGLKADFMVGGFQAQMPGDPNLPAAESVNCKCSVDYIPI